MPLCSGHASGSLKLTLARRSGAALVMALALLALASALLVGASAAARATARASRSSLAGFVADGEARRAAVKWRDAWDNGGSALGVGDMFRAPDERGGGTSASLPWVCHRAIRRLTARRWLVVAECEVGGDSALLARRRVALLLERDPADTATMAAPPRRVRAWGLADLH